MREDSLLVNVKLLPIWHRSLKAGLILKGIWKVPWNNASMEQVTLEQAEDAGRSLHVRQIGKRTRTGKGSSGLGTLRVDGAWVGYICDEPWEMMWVQPSCSRRCILAQGRGDAWRWWMVESVGTQARQWLGRCPAPSWG